jgi:hypothetical protein
VAVALTASEKLQLAATIIAAIAAVIALVNVAVARANERRRSQPIVIAHEAGEREFASSSSRAAWVVNSYVTSEGPGPAFNVRFGVEFAGVRYPYRLTSEDPEAGSIQRVLRPGEQRPAGGSWPILIDSLSMWGRAAQSDGDLDSKRVYWARYENAQGQTWESRNPGDRSAKLDIRCVRSPDRLELREQRDRREAQQHDDEWVRAALAELRSEAERADSTGAPGE